jgi:RimJ/RimL family protein N-acetyltransferase
LLWWWLTDRLFHDDRQNAMSVLLSYPTLSPHELDSLLYLRSDPLVAHMLLNYATQTTITDIRRWVISRNSEPSQRGLFTIYKPSSINHCQFVGYVVYDLFNSSRSFSLGVCISPDFRSKGFGLASVYKLISHLTVSYSPNKLVFSSLLVNSASIALFTKLGFSLSSISRGSFYSQGSYHDVVHGEKIL